MVLSSTLIYTSELILCSTICVPSATRHNIHLSLNGLSFQWRATSYEIFWDVQNSLKWKEAPI